MIKLTSSFYLDELLVSQTAARLGLDNTPPPEVVVELQRLCQLILQPLRDSVGHPIVVSSGYRARKVNKAVGGAKASAHLYGRAADFTIPGEAPRVTCQRIIDLGLPFDQVIQEFDRWVHVAIAPAGGAPRRQVLTARRVGGGTIYEQGLK
jgi:zinc D-Ala-D-Ala carboxypeptidase